MIDLRHAPLDLALRRTFRIAHGASDVRHNLLVEIRDGEQVGRGEAGLNPRSGQDHRSAAAAVEVMARRLDGVEAFEGAARRAAVPGETAAEAAVDMALRDLAGRRLGAPLWRILGLDLAATPPTSLTIGIDTPEEMARQAAAATGFEVLKIKLGSDDDRLRLEAVRAAAGHSLRVDANEGWSFAEALENLDWLAKLGVEMVEQPLPAAEMDAQRELRRRSPLPLFADESVGRAEDIPALAEAFDGVNLKLMKCGGIGETLRAIAVARGHGLRVMLGCMIESSLAVTAAAQIAPLVDFADLDGNLLLAADPFVGARLEAGRVIAPSGPGLGVKRRPPAPGEPATTQEEPCAT